MVYNLQTATSAYPVAGEKKTLTKGKAKFENMEQSRPYGMAAARLSAGHTGSQEQEVAYFERSLITRIDESNAGVPVWAIRSTRGQHRLPDTV